MSRLARSRSRSRLVLVTRIICAVRQQNFVLAVLGSFAVLSLVLAAVGIYGFVSYSVSGRAREIGIRIALGARPRVVRQRMFSSSMTVVVVGAVLGVVGALVLGKSLASLLYGVSPRDPVTLAVAPAVMLAAAVIAVAVPVIRYTRVDPVAVMRAE